MKVIPTGLPSLNVVTAFLAFSFYLAWLFEGGARKFSSLHTNTVATLLVTLLVLALVRVLTQTCGKKRDHLSIDVELHLYQVMMWASLITAFIYFDERWHINAIIILGGFTTTTALLVKRSILTGVWKVLLDATGVLALGVAFRGVSISRFPFGRNSDMLVLVQKALAAFLAGDSPYQVHVMDQLQRTYHLPLTYLPAKWLAYLPAHVLDLDLRWVNVALDASTYLVCLSVFLFISRKTPRKPLLGMAVVHAYFLNGYFMHRIDTEMAVYCFCVAMLFASLTTKRMFVAYILLGIALATSQLSLLLLPFLVSLTTQRYGVRKTLVLFALGILVALVTVVPFVLQSPSGFKAGLIDHWSMVAGKDYEWAERNMLNLNFSVHFFKHGWQNVLKHIQVVTCAALYCWYILRQGYERETDTWAFCALTTFGFLIFNVIVWTYLFQPVLLLAALSVLMWSFQMNCESDKGERTSPCTVRAEAVRP